MLKRKNTIRARKERCPYLCRSVHFQEMTPIERYLISAQWGHMVVPDRPDPYLLLPEVPRNCKSSQPSVENNPISAYFQISSLDSEADVGADQIFPDSYCGSSRRVHNHRLLCQETRLGLPLESQFLVSSVPLRCWLWFALQSLYTLNPASEWNNAQKSSLGTRLGKADDQYRVITTV